MTRALRLAALNAAWVILITVNSRVINAHFGTNLVVVALSQLAVSFGYFTLVKQIQGASSVAQKAAYCGGGAVGGVIGVTLTWWVR